MSRALKGLEFQGQGRGRGIAGEGTAGHRQQSKKSVAGWGPNTVLGATAVNTTDDTPWPGAHSPWGTDVHQTPGKLPCDQCAEDELPRSLPVRMVQEGFPEEGTPALRSEG